MDSLSSFSPAVIGNGTVSLGINPEGHLIADPGTGTVGLKYGPTGGDGLEAGCDCEGWGVGDLSTNTSGWASVDNGAISSNLSVTSFSATATTAASTVDVANKFEVQHSFVPSGNPALYRIDVSLKNISSSSMHLVYRRVMDWDVPPTQFSEYVTIQGASALVRFTSDDGFAPANPLAGPSNRGSTGTFVDEGPADDGALFDLDLGTTKAGRTKVFSLFYGAAGTETSALAALKAVGVDTYSLGQPSSAGGATSGTPNTFMFGIGQGPQRAPSGGAITTAERRNSKSMAGPAKGCGGDPCDTLTGNFFESYTDIDIPGRGIPLSVERSYNSDAAATDSAFGYGWSWNYGMRLAVSGSSATVFEEGGSELAFSLAGGVWSAAPRVLATLVDNGNGTFTFLRRGRDRFVFDATTGRLLRQVDRNDYQTTLSYDTGGKLASITDPGGRTLAISWSGTHVSKVADQVGRSVGYVYNGAGELIQVTDVRGGRTTLGYDGSHRMTTLRSARYFGDTTTSPSPVVTNHYDASGRVDVQTDQAGKTTSFDYTSIPDSTKVTDPEGDAVVHTYTYGLLTKVVRAYGTPQAATTEYLYDPATLGRVRQVDPNGHVSTMAYDDDANLIRSVDPLGRATAAEHNSFAQPTSITDASGVTTAFSYDAKGNLLSRSRPLLGPSGTTVATQAVTYHRDDPAHLDDATSITDPRGKTSSFAYVAGSGQVGSAADPLGNATTFSYDGAGRAISVVSPRGNQAGGDPDRHRSATLPDAAGLAVRSVAPTGRPVIDGFTRADAVGLGTTETTKAWTVGAGGFAVEAGTAKATGAGESMATVAAYGDGSFGAAFPVVQDGIGMVFRAINATNHWRVVTSTATTTWRLYRRVGGVDTLVGSSAPGTCCAPGARVVVRTAGNSIAVTSGPTTLISASDPLLAGASGVGLFAPGAGAGRLDDFVVSATREATAAYDADANLVSSSDELAKTTSYAYDALGRLTVVARPDATTEQDEFDDAGRLVVHKDGAGAATSYAHDAAGRVTSSTDPLGRVTAFSYDAADNQVSRTDAAGVATTFSYDDADQLVGIDYPDATPDVSFAYDALGRRSSMVDGDGTSSYSYDSLGRLVSSSDGSGATVGYGYNLADQLSALTYPAGAGTVTRSYDDAGRMVAVSDFANRTTAFSYDADANLVGQALPNATTTTRAFDDADRLLSLTHAKAPATLASFSYTRDAAGQLASAAPSGVAQGNESYTYSPLNQLAGVNTFAYTYDPADNLAGAGGRSLAHDAANQLTSATGVAPTKYYGHDPAGNRIASGSATLGYDAEDRLTSAATDDYPATVAADAPRAWWRLGEAAGGVAKDSSGNNFAGTYGAGTTLGAAGAPHADPDRALALSTTAATVEVADNAALDFGASGDFAVESWIKTTTNAEGAIVAKETSSSASPGWRITVTDDSGQVGRVRARVGPGAAEEAAILAYGPAIRVDDGAWHHVVVAFDRDASIAIYVDGVAAVSPVPNPVSVNNDAVVSIGASHYANAAVGTVDEVAIYPNVVSAARVAAHFAAGASAYRAAIAADAPRAWWRLGATGGTAAADASGHGYSGTYFAGTTAGVSGALVGDADAAARMATTAGTIEVPDNAGLDFGTTTDFSVEAWVKTTTNAEGAIVAKESSSTANPGWRITVTDDSGQVGRVRARIGAGGTAVQVYGPAIRVDDGAWHHVVVGFDRDTSVAIYVDGVGATTAVANNASVDNAEVVSIGASHYANAALGDIDEVAIYPTALSPARATAHFAAGSSTYRAAIAADSPRAWWRLGATGGTAVSDATGNGYGGTSFAGVTAGASSALVGDANAAVSMTTTAATIEVPDNAALDFGTGGDFSVESWVKTTTNGEGAIVAKETSSSANPGWRITVTDDSGQVGRIRARIGSGTAVQAYGPAIRVDDGAWHHVVVAFDRDTSVSIYVDGVGATTAVANNATVDNAEVLSIGASRYANAVVGDIDEVAIYPTTVSATQAKAHFGAGVGAYRAAVVADGPRAHWRLGATAGTTALDAMGNAYPGTYFAGTTAGVAGALAADTDKAARMVTAAGTIEVPDNAALDFGTTTDFSVEAWVKTTTNGEGAIVAKETSSTANPGWRITVTDDSGKVGRIRARIGSGTAVQAYGPAIRVDDGAWHHVVVGFQRTKAVHVYVDGVGATTTVANNATVDNTAALTIGASHYANAAVGDIDEVAVYPQLISAARVRAHHDAGRLEPGRPSATYAYNGEGLRMSTTTAGSTTRFVWDHSGPIPMALGDGTSLFVYGPDGMPIEQLDATGAPTYFHADQLGSTRLLTDATGAVVGNATYDAYGKLAATSGVSSRLGYAGEYTDAETGFQYLRARYYDPATGNFLTRDPFEAETREAYGYVGGDPLNKIDPSGMHPCGAVEQIGWRMSVNRSSRHCGLSPEQERQFLERERKAAEQAECDRREAEARARALAASAKVIPHTRGFVGFITPEILSLGYAAVGCWAVAPHGAQAGRATGQAAGPTGAAVGAGAGWLAGCAAGAADAYWTSSPVPTRR